MSETEKHVAALDDNIRNAAHDLLRDGEAIVAWIVVAGTRKLEGGGSTMTISSDQGVPEWQARGLLGSALVMLDALPPMDDDEMDV